MTQKTVKPTQPCESKEVAKSVAKSLAKSNDPIVLSGNVYLDKLLGMEHPQNKLPDTLKLRVGDLKVIALERSHLSGCRGVSGKSFAGFFAASIYDGQGWRPFFLRHAAKTDSTYDTESQRRARISSCRRSLEGLIHSTAIWIKPDSGSGKRNGAYQVHTPVSYGHVTKVVTSEDVTPKASVRSPEFDLEQVKKPVGKAKCIGASRSGRTKKRKAVAGQDDLFQQAS